MKFCLKSKTTIAVYSTLFLSMFAAHSTSAALPQVGEVPFIIEQNKASDNISVLMAISAAHSDGVSISSYGGAKAGYVNGLDNPAEFVEWKINVAEAADYFVYGMVSGNGTNQTLQITVDGSDPLQFSTGSHRDFSGWDKVDAGIISLPQGESTIRLAKTELGGSVNVKSLELIRESERLAYQQRITDFRSDTTLLSKHKFGIMLQYGHWGWPAGGGDKKDINAQADDFDVPNFINWVKSTGATYIVWSATWWTYELNAPSQIIDNIMNDGGETTSQRDLIGDIATAAKSAGLDFVLYYHSGQDVHRSSGYDSTHWWQKQNFPTTFAQRGYGNRSTFEQNWIDVIAELGNRYGDKLDAWFFDDGLVYYPGNFEAMGAAAKAGNPNRLIGYSSSGGLARVTEFQDINFGEACHGESVTGSAPVGGNGVFVSGPEKGLLQHCMFVTEPSGGGADWGIHYQGQVAGSPVYTASQLRHWIDDASSRSVPLSVNFMMYEDGSIAPASAAVIQEYAQNEAILTYNDNHSELSKTGDWATASSRGVGDYNDDVTYTTTQGDTITYQFYGDKVAVISPKNHDNTQNLSISLNGVSTVLDVTSSNYQAQQTIFIQDNLSQNQKHTLVIAAGNNGYSQLDAIKIYKPNILNNDDTSLVYDGNWSHSTNRGAQDINDDIHYTYNDGDFLEISFNGTGIEVFAPKDSGGGTFDVYIDNILVQSAVSLHSSDYQSKRSVFANVDLAAGNHTLKLVKTGGTYIQIDAMTVYNASK
ncbi:carbohydrate-binding protein [Vibrio ponticus]|uniref:Carbohydrate-binding protein n=2 Tax=Vibrio ponticus TaxID=265668 RepID=A0A3N3DRH0_9VIBR|nr:carbohydrate-binding protein [Vibrio ponticus]